MTQQNDSLPPDLVKLKQAIRDGMEQDLSGLNDGTGRLQSYTYGSHRATYTLIGAESGVGKTTVTDIMILSQVQDAIKRGIPIKVFYFSFEIDAVRKLAKWVGHIVYLSCGVHMPLQYILGRIKGKPVSPEHEVMIDAAMLLLTPIVKHIEIIDSAWHPTRIFNHIVTEHYENSEVGIVYRDKPKEKQKHGFVIGFQPTVKWRNGYTIGVVDHVALTMPEQGQDTKATIDNLSRKVILMRNIFGMSWYIIQQFSTDLMSAQRMLKGRGKGEISITPQRLDFGDSKYTYRDADVVYGLISPAQYDLEVYHGYDITKFYNSIVFMHLMKNRDGPSQRCIPFFLDPIGSVIEALPIIMAGVNDDQLEHYYHRANKIEEICQYYSPRDL